ncbi:MAG: aspartate carbamoyltransferase [Sphingobacteriales bacterium]|nr:aspartate carbamoyltransferase [Sphingobacteriales bacterium]
MNSLKNRSLVSINDFSKEEQLLILDQAAEFEKNPRQPLLNGYVIASLFFEPSTRTRLSFESAISMLGGRIIGFSEAGTSSVSKGESLRDTIRTVNNYCDLIIMRHPIDGSARFASEVSRVPVVNAGDGANQHPTQTLLDMYTIRQTQKRLENLKIGFVGDLKYGRTVHSLLMAMANFNCEFAFVSPRFLAIPQQYKDKVNDLGLNYSEHNNIGEVINDVDILYMTRIQRERFSDPAEYEKVKNFYELKLSDLENAKPGMKVLHPLPRVNEINIEVDQTEKAYYFEQALNGVYVRQAIISMILGVVS